MSVYWWLILQNDVILTEITHRSFVFQHTLFTHRITHLVVVVVLLFFNHIHWYLLFPHVTSDISIWWHEPWVDRQWVVTQPGLAAVPLTLHGVSGGRTDAGPPHQERSTWPTQNGRQLPQVCGVPPLKKKKNNNDLFQGPYRSWKPGKSLGIWNETFCAWKGPRILKSW